MYTKDSIERVKDRVDMVELVGPRVDLRRAGHGRYMGLCPFHDERTPSFSVDADHLLYHCFGCGESGDAIRFVERTESLDFRAAVELLADRYGVELEREHDDPQAEAARARRARLLGLVDRAASYYERFLWQAAEAKGAREYLAGRGLGEEVLRAFRVGYAPGAWDRLLVAAQRDGYSPDELEAAGLAQRGRSGGRYDRFRSRIMFPLADPRGRALGFGARAVRPDQRPKYLNTSENELYHKGRQLFGVDRARAAAARAGRVIAVEGYTDVLALHQAGAHETVAIMGTALTDDQLAELGRAARTVLLALDADRAGQDAMLRAARSARDRGIELLVVSMPDGSDPADMIASDGADAFRALLDGALSVPEFEVRRALALADLSTARGRDRALAAVRPIVASLEPRSVTRDEVVRYVADRLDVPREYLMVRAAAPRRAATPQPKSPVDALAGAERGFLTMSVALGDAGLDCLRKTTREHFTSAPLWAVREHLVHHWSDKLGSLPEDDPELSALIMDVVMRADTEHVTAEVLQLTYLQLEKGRVERAVRRAQQTGDYAAQDSLARARQTLRQEIDDLMAVAQ